MLSSAPQREGQYLPDLASGLIGVLVHGSAHAWFCPVLPQVELDTDRTLDCQYVLDGQRTELIGGALLGDGANLMRHCLLSYTVHGDERLTGIDPSRVCGQRHDLNSIEDTV